MSTYANAALDAVGASGVARLGGMPIQGADGRVYASPEAYARAHPDAAGRAQAQGYATLNMISITQGAVSLVVLFMVIASLFELSGASFGAMNRAQTWMIMVLVVFALNVFFVGAAIVVAQRAGTHHHPAHYKPFISQFAFAIKYLMAASVLIGAFIKRFKENGSLADFNDRYDVDLQAETTPQRLTLMVLEWHVIMGFFLLGSLVYLNKMYESIWRHRMQMYARDLILGTRSAADVAATGGAVVMGTGAHVANNSDYQKMA